MAGYVERALAPGEQIAYRAHLHGVLYLAAGLPALAAIAAITAARFVPTGFGRTALLVLALLALLACLARLLGVWARIANTEIVVTSRRVVFKTGLIRRRSIEMNLDKVESVVVDQGLAGRVLNYGTVIIRGIGAGLEPVKSVAAPLEFRRRVCGA